MSAARTGAGPPAETAAARARRARAIARRLARRYPEAAIPLRHANPFQLLVATILSAQSTDAQVNTITPGLFQRYRTPADFAGARRQDLEKAIHSTGFFRAKTRALQNASRVLLERFSGEVPHTMEELVQLPGVGRKTANVVLSAFGVPGIVVDTHVRRVLRRVFLGDRAAPPDRLLWNLEEALLPRGNAYDFNQAMMDFGATVCTARRPRCPQCALAQLCASYPLTARPRRGSRRSTIRVP